MELDNNIKSSQKELNELGTDKLERLIDKSMQLLNEMLREKYKEKEEREIFTVADLRHRPERFVKELVQLMQ